ncbi:hypothetical protein [Fibrella forsythiae]|uniref:Outer membrane protein beta-barrel domain-containing protein n=1 Tax=Fibrella forsythiae TaxID=2817061 RepID=A0ABS3JF56_9BACT|nr:hypothetical protein [Fibrella forsythiae]MBO0948625.1 hypothetical protein [Fibrella forsythiae]
MVAQELTFQKNRSMKTLVLIITTTLLLTNTGWSQTQKGILTVGANVASGIWRIETATRTSVHLTPSVGYFLRDNLLVGFSLPLENTTLTFSKSASLTGIANIEGNTVGLSLFTRRYLSSTRFKPFIHAEVSYNVNSSRYTYLQGLPERSESGQFFRTGIGGGGAYFITDRFSLEATATLAIANLNVAIRNQKLDPSNRYVAIGIGGNWYVGNGKK